MFLHKDIIFYKENENIFSGTCVYEFLLDIY